MQFHIETGELNRSANTFRKRVSKDGAVEQRFLGSSYEDLNRN